MSKQIKSNHEWGREKARSIAGPGLVSEKVVPEANPLMQEPQAPEDRHGPKYDNDASGWVRGQGSPHPHFDKKG